MNFEKFKKIPRLSRDCIITEKIDGTNGQICIIKRIDLWYACDSFEIVMYDFIDKYCLYKTLAIQDENDIIYMFAGSRKKWLDTSSNGDNFGFAKWVKANAEELLKLGEGRHFGEWYGKGIQRGYGLNEKRFALFNVGRWHKNGDTPRLISIDPKTKEEKYTNPAPKCCDVVPILDEGMFDTEAIQTVLDTLQVNGSYVSSGFMNPEGIIIFHKASGQLFKKTIKDDEKPKGI
jgi:hypothetical protein